MRSSLKWLALALFLALAVVSFQTAAAQTAQPFSLKVYSPEAEVQKPPEVKMAPRLGDLAGKKIGIINNTKAGADKVQPYLEAALKKLYPTVQLTKYSISYNAYAGKEADLKKAADASDGVIVLLGD